MFDKETVQIEVTTRELQALLNGLAIEIVELSVRASGPSGSPLVQERLELLKRLDARLCLQIGNE